MNQYIISIGLFLLFALMARAAPLGGTTVDPSATPESGYFAPADQPIDMPDFSWRTYPTGASHFQNRPWIQPRVPTGPIVFPASSSIGSQYAGVIIPQPILPFANHYISYPRNSATSKGEGYTDFTNKLAPPIFLEQDVDIQTQTQTNTEVDVGVDVDVETNTDIEAEAETELDLEINQEYYL